jgi:beta-N-acetylhexosaminidase
MGFYLLKEMIEKITKTPFEKYLTENFYKPLGMAHTCFNPLNRFNIKEINPTENDTVFRHQVVHGYVHDPGAAMLGGVSGHAGLFSNANDLAIYLQMILQKGEYGGVRYLKESTVNEFTKYQFPENNNRRGLGFDKPALPGQKINPACASASPEKFWSYRIYRNIFLG